MNSNSESYARCASGVGITRTSSAMVVPSRTARGRLSATALDGHDGSKVEGPQPAISAHLASHSRTLKNAKARQALAFCSLTLGSYPRYIGLHAAPKKP